MPGRLPVLAMRDDVLVGRHAMRGEMGKQLIGRLHRAVGGQIERPRDIASPGNVAFGERVLRPHVDHDDMAMVSRMEPTPTEGVTPYDGDAARSLAEIPRHGRYP